MATPKPAARPAAPAAAKVIRPQAGPQEQFLASTADVVIYGGAAYGGKTFALLLEAARFSQDPQFGAVIFRRTSPQITAEGGLWDTSEQIYPLLGAEGIGQRQWRFPSGARVTFSHLQHEKDKFSWQGAQLPLIGLDELTHFTEGQFWYLVSRNRDPSGTVRPYIRATTNPDPDSWVATLIAWWIDQDTGYAIPERSGIVRWLARVSDTVVWASSREALLTEHPGAEPLSLTFIASSYKDNPLGLASDPGYVARLSNLPRVEAERLKHGNWLVRAAAGDYFRRSDFRLLRRAEVPPGGTLIRYWDRAATVPSERNPDPDWTAGVRMRRVDDDYYIEDIIRERLRPGGVQALIHATAEADGRGVRVGIERDPAQAGIVEADLYVRLLAGYQVVVVVASQAKTTRAAPLSAQVQGAGAGQGHVYVVEAPWNDAFFAECESFPLGAHDDQVDAASGAFGQLASLITGPVTVASAGRRLVHLLTRRY